jgi:SNF2 family DNA or RNA helicase
MLTTHLHKLEEPISSISPNEKYFGYYLPQTDTRYLRRHLNKNGAAYNGLIGCFEDHNSSYDTMIVLVKVSIQNTTSDTTIINEEEFHKMFTATDHVSYLNATMCSESELQTYKFEYFMIEYNLHLNYETTVRTIRQSLNGTSVSTETVAKLLLYSMGNYMQKAQMLNPIPAANAYRCSQLTDIEFVEQSYSDNTTMTFILNNNSIAGLFNYLKNKNVAAHASTTQAELFKNMICPNDNSYVNSYTVGLSFKKHYRDESADMTILYETSTAYGSITHFANITWRDVIGSKLAQYMCPSYGKKSLSYKLSWVNESQRLTYITRIINFFEMINRPELFKLCITQTNTGTWYSITYSLYISSELRTSCFTPDDQNRIKFGINITNVLQIISDKNDSVNTFGNTHHLDTEDKINTKIIFNTNPYGIYNPKLAGIDDVISTEAILQSGQLIDTQLNTVFPTMATAMQSQIIPFSYQKRNIIWMNEIERKVTAGEHKIKLQAAKLANYMYNSNVSSYKLFDTDYYYIGTETDSGSYSEYENYLYSNKNNCLDMELTLSGGFICDDVGLGKTYSTISHIMCQRANDIAHGATWDLNNCVIIPSRLLQQWKFEIEKYTQPKTISVVTLGSITDIKKLYKKAADGTLYMPVKYDVYIISVNLLNNKNYTAYIADNYEQTLETPVYNLNKYFDIFRIRWNRIIVDEAHERIMSTYNWSTETISRDNATMGKAERVLTNNIVYNMTSNFRWGLSATPFEHTSNNIIGYICWQAKELKNNLSNPVELAEKYKKTKSTELDVFNDSAIPIYKKGFCYIPTFISPTNIKRFQQNCFTKTTKRYVSGELNIPIFTEEIKEIELGQIERNVYNNARADNSNVRHTAHIDRIKRLFQLCTNICISDVDIENLGIGADSHMTLEQLNKAMIKNFEKQLKSAQNELERERADGPSFEQKKQLSKRLKDYIETCVDPGIEAEMNSYAGQRIKYFIEACGTGNGHSNGVRATDIDMIVMKNLRRDLYGRLLECGDNLDNMFVLVSEIMCTHPSGVKPDWDDNKVLMVTYYLISSFYSKANQNSKDTKENITKLEREVVRLQNQIKLFESNDFIKEKTTEPCIICWAEYAEESSIAVTDCRHIFCGDCFHAMGTNKSSFPCPECRTDVHCKKIKITTMKELTGKHNVDEPVIPVEAANTPIVIDWKTDCISKYGTKMSVLIEYLNGIISEEGKNNRAIIFSQYDNMLKLIGKTLTEYKISNVYCKGNVHVINKNIDKFKRDPSLRVIMLSSEHSNSGSNLTEASHIILVDVLNMDKEQTKEVECQAIGRAVRLGQQKPVTVVRLITKNTVESEYYTKNKYDIATIQ